MIKKLRRKFILLSMGALMLVLLIIIGSINVLNYRKVVEDADSILAILGENNGTFPKEGHKGGGYKISAGQMSPELPYESRYFSVMVSENGGVTSVDTGRITAVDTTAAREYAQSIWESGKTTGFIQDYRYLSKEKEDGETLIIFLDCGRNLTTCRAFLFISCGIAAVGLLAVFLLIVLLSGRIIRPVSDSYEKQKRFITDAGHELKTPLTIIDADADILAMDLEDNEWLQDIRLQTEKLARLTNSLTYLSRMEEEKVQLQMIEFPFSDVVEETVQSFQSLARTGGKTLTTDIQPMLSLKGDEHALRQLVSILLDNSLKYSQEGGRISVALKKHGRSVQLQVFNTAEAVSQEELAHYFERFFRSDKSRNSASGGYGLGLSIARAVVTAHKGKITASTSDGHSLLITITLPAS